jgi:CubicO group peptidase (beta-lactamase class C family)
MDRAAIETLLESAVANGVAPGFTAAVATPQGVQPFAAGARAVGDSTPMDASTIFWIASCTKGIVSACALQMVERGLLDLDEPVGRLIPQLAKPRVLTGVDPSGEASFRPAGRPITLRMLLTHTCGLAYNIFHADLERHLGATGQTMADTGCAGMPLVCEPGEAWQYGTGIDVAGLMIEAATGLDLGEVLAETLLDPLGMADTTFDPTPDQAARRAGLHMRLPDGGLQPIGFGGPGARDLRGGGGLYSTAADYLKFLRLILDGGEADGRQLLSPASLALLSQNQTADLAGVGDLDSAMPERSADFRPMPGVSKGHTLGFVQNLDPAPGGRSAGSLAWGGFANCFYWADPAAQKAGVLFAQFLPFGDPRMMDLFDCFERAVYAPPRAVAAGGGLSTALSEA